MKRYVPPEYNEDDETLVRLPEACAMLGLKKTAFYENFVTSGRIRKVQITKQAVGYVLSDIKRERRRLIEAASK